MQKPLLAVLLALQGARKEPQHSQQVELTCRSLQNNGGEILQARLPPHRGSQVHLIPLPPSSQPALFAAEPECLQSAEVEGQRQISLVEGLASILQARDCVCAPLLVWPSCLGIVSHPCGGQFVVPKDLQIVKPQAQFTVLEGARCSYRFQDMHQATSPSTYLSEEKTGYECLRFHTLGFKTEAPNISSDLSELHLPSMICL